MIIEQIDNQYLLNDIEVFNIDAEVAKECLLSQDFTVYFYCEKSNWVYTSRVQINHKRTYYGEIEQVEKTDSLSVKSSKLTWWSAEIEDGTLAEAYEMFKKAISHAIDCLLDSYGV
jgi:hypothetical protein